MFTEERHELILKELEKNSVVYVSSLVETLDTSESTIRRDLNFLHNQGKLNKVHGGATAIKKNIHTKDDEIEVRKNLHTEEKIAIARKAASLIKANDFVYIDAGTTTELMIDFIEEKNAVYVTNGINHASRLVSKGFTVYILAGEVKILTQAIIGIEAVNCIKKYNFTKGFFGTNGVCIEKGFTTPEIKEALVKETALKKAREAYILADDSKFNEVSCVTFADIKDAAIITSNIDNKYKELVKADTKILEVVLR